MQFDFYIKNEIAGPLSMVCFMYEFRVLLFIWIQTLYNYSVIHIPCPCVVMA